MKLDVNSLRYLSKEEWRVLGSVELGQRNVSKAVVVPYRCRRYLSFLLLQHEMVPKELIVTIANLK